ncbi:hypothetical protein RAB80_001927 [Fusarium oxysporum f. sp. vasinfectum]|nr:hypothetical protein RAB80_001927 [Fusarium oxysporum f. sp. vasinfectum]
MANGISSAGSGVGGAVFTWGTAAMIKHQGLDWALRATGIITFVGIVIATLLLRHRNSEIQPNQRAFDIALLRSRAVVLLLMWAFTSMFGYIVLLFSLSEFALAIGLSHKQATDVVGFLNVRTAIGRPLIGLVSDRFSRVATACVLTLLCGLICFVLWLPATSFGLTLFFSIVCGAILGVFWMTIGPLSAEVAGVQNLQAMLSLGWTATILPTASAEVIALMLQGLPAPRTAVPVLYPCSPDLHPHPQVNISPLIDLPRSSLHYLFCHPHELARLNSTSKAKMPRKHKTAATVAENRDAQRRSRARRQELIADLQSRLEEYERMGVEASIEMQRVAQAVSVQNQRLKDLLGVYGVSDCEIERYLSSPEEHYRALTGGYRCSSCGRLLLGITQTSAVPTDDPPQGSSWSAPSMAGDAAPMMSNLIPPTGGRNQPSSTEPLLELIQPQEENEEVLLLHEEEPIPHHDIHKANGAGKTAGSSSSAPTDVLSPLSDSFHSGNQSEPLETSCDKAAEILVEFHSHTDPSWARAALGCRGDNSCSVKNTKIFQLMDHIH